MDRATGLRPADIATWRKVEAMIAAEAAKLCARTCSQTNGLVNCIACTAKRHPGWRHEALESLRVRP